MKVMNEKEVSEIRAALEKSGVSAGLIEKVDEILKDAIPPHKKLVKELMSIERTADKLGETFYDFFMEEDNFVHEIGKSLLNTILSCTTEEEFKKVNDTVIAICGYSIDRHIDKIKERDQEGYCWESI